MKKTNKVLALFIAMVMILSLFSFLTLTGSAAEAEDEDTAPENLAYNPWFGDANTISGTNVNDLTDEQRDYARTQFPRVIAINGFSGNSHGGRLINGNTNIDDNGQRWTYDAGAAGPRGHLNTLYAMANPGQTWYNSGVEATPLGNPATDGLATGSMNVWVGIDFGTPTYFNQFVFFETNPRGTGQTADPLHRRIVGEFVIEVSNNPTFVPDLVVTNPFGTGTGDNFVPGPAFANGGVFNTEGWTEVYRGVANTTVEGFTGGAITADFPELTTAYRYVRLRTITTLAQGRGFVTPNFTQIEVYNVPVEVAEPVNLALRENATDVFPQAITHSSHAAGANNRINNGELDLASNDGRWALQANAGPMHAAYLAEFGAEWTTQTNIWFGIDFGQATAFNRVVIHETEPVAPQFAPANRRVMQHFVVEVANSPEDLDFVPTNETSSITQAANISTDVWSRVGWTVVHTVQLEGDLTTNPGGEIVVDLPSTVEARYVRVRTIENAVRGTGAGAPNVTEFQVFNIAGGATEPTPGPVTAITVPTSQQTGTVGTAITLTPTLIPANNTATGAVTWVLGVGSTAAGATVTEAGVVSATGAGTVVAIPTAPGGAEDGTNFVGEPITITFAEETPVIPAPEHIAVTGITVANRTFTAGANLTLAGVVAPTDATNSTITWSIVTGAGTTAAGAALNGAVLTATGAGSIRILATIANGTNETTAYTQEFDITVNAAAVAHVPVTGITPPATSFIQGQSINLNNSTVAPATATNRTITWQVVNANDTGATITDGVLRAPRVGTVVIRGTIANGTAVGTNFVTNDIQITVQKSEGSAKTGEPVIIALGAVAMIAAIGGYAVMMKKQDGTTSV